MADNLRKYTTQEVLNKVYTDSSGNSIGLNSATSKETLNAVLTSGADSLNVALSGGTISGDVTIAGDLTVQGDGSGTYSEIITGVLQISNTTINGAPINLLSRDTAIDSDQEGVRIRFGKSDDSFLADYGYRRWTSSDKGATITSTDNLRLVLTGQNVSHFMFKGNNSTVGSVLDIRTHETTVIANDVLGKITFSAAHEASGTDAILAGAEIKALATDTFAADNNETDLIFSTASSDAEHGSATSGAVFERMRITSAGLVGIGTDSPDSLLELESSATTGHTLSMKGTSGNASVRLKLDFNGNAGSQGSKGYLQYNNSTNSIELQSGGGIRFQPGGTTDRMILDTNSRISLSNNDNNTSNTVFGKTAFNAGSDNDSDYNVALGELAMGTGSVSGAQYNVAVGYVALEDITSGDGNTTIGSDSLKSLTTGASNVAVGKGAAASLGAGESQNIAIGAESMVSADEGSGSGNEIDNNIAIGYQSLTMADFGSTGSRVAKRNIAIGSYALNSTGTNSQTGTIAIGYEALTALTSGASNSAIGYSAGNELTTGANNVIIGYNALHSADGAEHENTVVGSNAGSLIDNDASSDNVLIGYLAGSGGSGEIDRCVVIGHQAMDGTTSHGGTQNIFIGNDAGGGNWGGASDSNVAIGATAMSGVMNDANNNTTVGHDGLKSITSGKYNTTLGSVSGTAITTGEYNIAIGADALLTEDTGSANIAIGYQALKVLDYNALGHNIAIGHQAGLDLASGPHNVFIGGQSGFEASSNEGCVFIGYQAGKNTKGAYHNNIAIGKIALSYSHTHTGTVAVGYAALEVCTGGEFNTAVGYRAGDNVNDGNMNTLIGYDAGSRGGSADGITTGSSNTAVGYRAVSGSAGSPCTGDGNTGIGTDSLKGLSGAGGYNTAVGYLSGDSITSGTNNTLIGYNADIDNASDSHQVKIGSYGIIKYKTARVNITAAHNADNTVIKEVFKIPALSIIHRVTATLITRSNTLSTYNLNLRLSTETAQAADDTLGVSGITVPELLGADGVATYAQNSATTIGTNADIVASSAATNKTVYTSMPTTTIVGTADTYLYICNSGTGNGTTASVGTVVIDICVEYQGTQ